MAIDPYINFNPDPKPPPPKGKAVGTPEGDNEFAPNDPIQKLPEGAEQKPR